MPGSRLLQHALDEQARKNPLRLAGHDGQGRITYQELARLSNRLAHNLRSQGINRQDRVVFCMQRSVDCLTAIFGILKADAIYVPLDPKTPEERWRAIIEDCQPRAIICDDATARRIMATEGNGRSIRTQIIMFEQGTADPGSVESAPVLWLDSPACEDVPPVSRNDEEDVAYIMYTSGSSGQPKGVMVTHANVRAYIDWAVEYLGLTSEDRILSTAPFHFDMSTFDVHGTIQAGGTLCVATEMLTLFPEKLVRFIEEHEITVWKGVSSLLMYLARTGVIDSGRMTSLKTILFAGEALPTKYLIKWMTAHPEKQFFNAYGPTEATGVSLCYQITRRPTSALERIPIGRPRKGTEVFLVKDDLSMAGEGEVGELCISGPGLAREYLNDPEKTAQAFVQLLAGSDQRQRVYRTGDLAILRSDGNYEFISRKDRQVKIMGYRIELGEIEHALLSVDGVDDAAVLTSATEMDSLPELVAYYQSAHGCVPAEVMAELKKLLPAYMLPKKLLRIDNIPRTERGKIDRKIVSPGHAGVVVN